MGIGISLEVYEVRGVSMIKDHNFRIVGYTLLCGVLLFWVSMQPVARLQPIVLQVPYEYPTIQAAVEAAPEGATILIGPGTYMERINIAKSLTIEGHNIKTTILEPPVPPSPFDENPVFTVQAPGREVTLQIRQLTVRSRIRDKLPTDTGIKVLTNTNLVLEQTAWVDLLVVIDGPLQSLEAQGNLFERDHIVFSKPVLKAALRRNQFIKGASMVLYGQHLVAHENVVVCTPQFWEFSQVGIAFELSEGGYAEIVRNSVTLCERGVIVPQYVQEARVIIQDNGLFTNNRNLILDSRGRIYPEIIHPRIDWLIKDNTIGGGGIGIDVFISGVEGGQIFLTRNRIIEQRKQYLGIHPPTDIWRFGNGISLFTFLRKEDLKEPLKIEISENRIESNEAWGLALNLIPGWDGRPDECNVKAPGEEQVFIDPEITGSGNIFRDNGKGDLCPPDYPWPPGFRK